MNLENNKHSRVLYLAKMWQVHDKKRKPFPKLFPLTAIRNSLNMQEFSSLAFTQLTVDMTTCITSEKFRDKSFEAKF